MGHNAFDDLEWWHHLVPKSRHVVLVQTLEEPRVVHASLVITLITQLHTEHFFRVRRSIVNALLKNKKQTILLDVEHWHIHDWLPECDSACAPEVYHAQLPRQPP